MDDKQDYSVLETHFGSVSLAWRLGSHIDEFELRDVSGLTNVSIELYSEQAASRVGVICVSGRNALGRRSGCDKYLHLLFCTLSESALLDASVDSPTGRLSVWPVTCVYPSYQRSPSRRCQSTASSWPSHHPLAHVLQFAGSRVLREGTDAGDVVKRCFDTPDALQAALAGSAADSGGGE
jgi:hypothetical protein